MTFPGTPDLPGGGGLKVPAQSAAAPATAGQTTKAHLPEGCHAWPDDRAHLAGARSRRMAGLPPGILRAGLAGNGPQDR